MREFHRGPSWFAFCLHVTTRVVHCAAVRSKQQAILHCVWQVLLAGAEAAGDLMAAHQSGHQCFDLLGCAASNRYAVRSAAFQPAGAAAAGRLASAARLAL
jgi:hypothetical protein